MANSSIFRHIPFVTQCLSFSFFIQGILSQIKYSLMRRLILFDGLKVSYPSNTWYNELWI